MSVLHSHLLRVCKSYLIILLCVGDDMILCVSTFWNFAASVSAFAFYSVVS